jgi:high affinity sulfate transporter 1
MTNSQPAYINPFARTAEPRGLDRWVPGLRMVRTYRAAWFAKDAAAGLVLTAILVPVGMGYAEAAGLPAIHGLYATVFPLIAYAVFGPSRILVLGPDSALAGIIAATILPLSGGNTVRAVELAGMLAVLSGLFCILAGLTRLSFVTELLSTPIRYGYLNGIALTVLAAQSTKILGFPVPTASFLKETVGIARGIWDGQTNWTAFAIGTACLAVILLFRRFVPRIPGVLVAVVGATIFSAFLSLGSRHALAVLGPLPQGLPALRVPTVSADEVIALLGAAIAIALISFADMSVLSRTFALRGGYEVDGNQEILALGAANIASGIFGGFSVSSSASRTPVAEAAGAKTQFAGVWGALCIALLLIFAPNLLQDLPSAALGAVVIAACLSLVEANGVIRLMRLRRAEFLQFAVCFLGVALIGVIQGIFIAVALALMSFIWRAWRPYDAVLGRVDGLKGYHDITRHPEARQIPGLVLFRWDAPLFFANAGIFRDHVLRAVAASPTPVKWVVVAAEPVTDIDITAADMLAELDADLHTAGMDLCFAEMKGPVKDHLKRYGLFTKLGTGNFFPTIGQAVDQYLAAHNVLWKDWDEA